MQKEIRTVCYDDDLHIEAYRLEGIVRPFPNHFHDHYVIGLIVSGTRRMFCKNREYTVSAGDILLFSPKDSHSCIQQSSTPFDYRALNISKETMTALSHEITGSDLPVSFSESVVKNEEAYNCLFSLHCMITEGSGKLKEPLIKSFHGTLSNGFSSAGNDGCALISASLKKKEKLLTLMSLLIKEYCKPVSGCIPGYNREVENACEFINGHYSEHITLNDLCICSNLSRSTLLRAFTDLKGVTPYRYLQAVRIEKAKKLLEQGVPAADAALQTGFSDQSHFTNFFNMFTGLSPAAYKRIFKKDSR